MATPAVQKEIADAILKLKSLHLYEVEYALRILINYAIERMFIEVFLYIFLIIIKPPLIDVIANVM